MIDPWEGLSYLVWTIVFCWLILMALARCYRPEQGAKEAKNVKVVITSIANEGVQKVLYGCIDQTMRILGIKPIVLLDEDSALTEALREKVGRDNVVVVPKNFMPHLVGKGRAMYYFAQTGIGRNFWCLFLDEDTLLQDRRILTEILAYAARGYVAANGVIVPKRGKSDLAYVMDSIRRFDELTFYRFFTGRVGVPLLGMHGECLLLRGDILQKVIAAEASIAEDCDIAEALVRQGFRTWQSATRVLVLSPNSLSDLTKQRTRWFQGLSRSFAHCPFSMRAVAAFRVAVGALWVVGALMFPLSFFQSGEALAFLVVPGLYAWSMYVCGISKLRRCGSWWMLALVPFFGVLETIMPMLSRKQEGFVIIDKSLE